MQIVEDKDFLHVLRRRFQEPHSLFPSLFATVVPRTSVLWDWVWCCRKSLEDWGGAWTVTLPAKETWTCTGSSGCAISCVRPGLMPASPGCPERCWSSYRNMGGFAMEAFHLGECLSGQRLSRQSWCLQLHSHMNTDLRHPHSFLKKLSQDPLSGAHWKSCF